MIGVDNNVLLRLFVDDDPTQARAARDLVAEAPTGGIFVTQLAIVETLWLLRRSFGWKRDEQVRFLTTLLDSPVFKLENRFDFEKAADRFLFGKGEFPDCLIEVATERAGVDTIYTFDGKAADRRLFTRLHSKG